MLKTHSKFLLYPFFLLTTIFLHAQLQPLEAARVSIYSGNETILLGKINRANLTTDAKFNSWFASEYNFHKIPDGWGASMKGFTEGVTAKIFMGTWCADTRRELGAAFKVLDTLQISDARIEMYALSEYKDSPQQFEKGLDIYNVPTVIFYKKGEEMNRVVEFPVESWHADVERILKGLPYKHSYSE